MPCIENSCSIEFLLFDVEIRHKKYFYRFALFFISLLTEWTYASNMYVFEHIGTEWQQAIIAECSEVNGFQLPMVICTDEDSIRQNDLLLLSTKKVFCR